MHELTLRAEIDERRRLERERLQQQRQAELERKRQAAREAMTTEAWGRQLDRQVDAHRRAAHIRDYAHNLETRLDELPATQDDDTGRWITWMRAHADDIDPLLGPNLPVAPATPTFRDYEVERWMREQHR